MNVKKMNLKLINFLAALILTIHIQLLSERNFGTIRLSYYSFLGYNILMILKKIFIENKNKLSFNKFFFNLPIVVSFPFNSVWKFF